MDLIQLKKYLQSRTIVPLQDMAHHFQVEIEAVRPLLDVWISKGKVRKRQQTTSACKGCCKCDPATIEVYEWIMVS